MADMFRRYGQRALDFIRGEPNLDKLVRQGLQLGEGVHVARPLYIDSNRPWLISIGDYVNIGPYSVLLTHDDTLHNHTGLTRIGRVVIRARVMIGVGAIILPGTVIGEDSVIGAGAIVQGEIPPGSLVAAEPSKVSNLRAVAAWQRASAAKAPTWPMEGWSMDTGITDARKREQREALDGTTAGFLPARAADGSPYARRGQRPQPASEGASTS